MGLLNTFFGNADQTQALGLLGVGMMNGGFGQGAGMAMQHLGNAPQRRTQALLADAQLQETLAQAEERKHRMEMARQAQERQNALLFGSPSPGGVPMAAGPSGAAAGGSPAGGLIGFARQLGIPEQAIQADIAFNGGKKIAELLAERAKPNWTNVNGNLVNTNQPGFQGGLQAGMSAGRDGQVTAWQPDGQGGVVVGAPRGAFETYGRYQGIAKGTEAAHSLEKVVGPDGAERFVPRSQVISAAQPQVAPRPVSRVNPADADRYAILTQELQRAQQAGNVQDVAALQNEIARLAPGAKTAPSPSGLAVAGPFQATPTTAQAAEAAGAKVRAEAGARADVERQAGRTRKTDQANEMMSNIQRAKTLLEMDPTGSLGGAAVDKVIGSVGLTTPSGNTASALETLSGWLVANVPRMEGPQSNFDVDNYKTMAGKIGDRKVPVKERQAALAEVERIQSKYAHLNGSAPAAPEAPKAPPPKPMKGMVRNGYRFKGGDPSKQENWEKQ